MRSIFFTVPLLAAGLALAQEPDVDPPSRAVRLSYVAGNVSFQAGGVEDWAPATLNRPMTTGDALWTEIGGRAELHSGSAAIRLNSRTNVTLLNASDTVTQIQLPAGSVSVRLRRLSDQETFEIDTPHVAFSLLRPGEYRVDVNEQGNATILTVRGGQGEATAGSRVFPVRPRQQVRITGTGDGPPEMDERDLPVADNFDSFCASRDRREDLSESGRHVSREMPGYADLDSNGVWREDAQYGWIWAPRVAVGWAPYHYGHWAWIAPWGWTWVDDAPWGYAPFHYGRWAFAGANWVWVPGPAAVRPVYAPALVAWVGGPRFGVDIAIGGGAAVGWFALGPGELWAPAYRASPRYFNQVNVTNTVVNNNVNVTNVYNNVYVNKTTNVTNTTYVNQRVNGAVAAVPHDVMVGGRPVAPARVALPANAAAAAQIQTAAPVAPQRASVLGGAAGASAAPPASISRRALVARTPPPSAPVPFAQQQPALQSNPGQPVNNSTLDRMRNEAPQGPVPQRGAIRQVGPASPANPTPAPQAPAQPQVQPQIQPQIRRERTAPAIVNPPPVREQTTRPQPEAAPVPRPQTEVQPRGPVSPREQKGRPGKQEEKQERREEKR